MERRAICAWRDCSDGTTESETRRGCSVPCKEQAGNRDAGPALISYSRRLVRRAHAAVWLRLAKMIVGFVWPKCATLSCPHAEEHRSATRAQVLPKPKRAAMRLEA